MGEVAEGRVMRRLLGAVLAGVLVCAPAADARRHHHRHGHRDQHAARRCDNGTGGIAPFEWPWGTGGIAPFAGRCR